MDELGNPNGPEFSEVISAAREENWDYVDQNLSSFANDDEVVDWARSAGATSDDDNERDLAASILEKTNHDITEQDKDTLRGMMQADKNPYAQFRASFALFNHGDRSEAVIGKIKEATKDEDVKDIAEKYLSQIEK